MNPAEERGNNARSNALLHLIMQTSRSPSSNDSPRRGSHQMSLLDASSIAAILQLSPSEMRHHRLPMPLKLYSILNSASEDVVSWLPDGRGFQIRHPERFEREILSRYFDYGNQNYVTFIQLLALWDFKAGPDKSYCHQVSLATVFCVASKMKPLIIVQYLVRGFPEHLCSMHLSADASGGTSSTILNSGNPCPPLLPMVDFDSMEHSSSLCELRSKPSLQPRIAFSGSPFFGDSQTTFAPLSHTKKEQIVQTLTIAAHFSAEREHPKPAVVSPTSICAAMSGEDSSYQSMTSSPPAKKARWLPQLGPASPDEQPLFSAPREESGLEYSSWFSTNPELFATLAESSNKF